MTTIETFPQDGHKPTIEELLSSTAPLDLSPEEPRRVVAPPKVTDNRGKHFTDTETWQVEALDPNDLARLLEEAILARLDRGIYEAVLAEQEETRQDVLSLLGMS